MGASESREQKISALALTAAKRLVENCDKGIVKMEANGHSPDTVKYEFTHAGMHYNIRYYFGVCVDRRKAVSQL
mgnify:FL=1